LHPEIRVLLADFIIALQLSRESYFVFPLSTVIDVRPEHPEKAYQPIDVTLLGMVIDVSPEQP
jgi:hypothetical protein